jgi:hypothetical protein
VDAVSLPLGVSDCGLAPHQLLISEQGDQKIGGKFGPIFEKVAKTVAKPKKCQNIFFKAKFESTKHLHQTLLNS